MYIRPLKCITFIEFSIASDLTCIFGLLFCPLLLHVRLSLKYDFLFQVFFSYYKSHTFKLKDLPWVSKVVILLPFEFL